MKLLQTLSFVVSLAVLAGVAAAAEHAAGDGGLTPRQLASITTVREAEISPDGTTIAFVRAVPRALFEEEDGEDWRELVLAATAGGEERPFVTGSVTVSKLRWLPDSSAVTFLAERHDDEHDCLYRISADGGEAVRIVALDEGIRDYAWSPDGTRVAVIATAPRSAEDEELREQGFDQEVYEEDWRPYRVWMATPGEEDIEALPLEGSAFQFRWSPDGKQLAVALAPRPLIDDSYMFQRISVVSAADGETVARVDHAAKLGQISWSPDGGHLAMIAGTDLHDTAESSLFVVPASGGVPRNLTPEFAGHVSDIAWQDADTLIFLADVGVTTELYRVSRNGGDLRGAGWRDAGAVFTSMSVAADGRTIALVGDAPQHPAEVFAAALDGAPPSRLSDSNPWLAEVRLAQQEIVRHRALDGLELEGLLIRPLDAQQGVRVPLVMVVHGGPEGHRRHGWLSRYSSPGQVLAARGFAVFYPNYRGSTGRGVEFALTSQGDPAGTEFDDLVDAVDHLVASGLVDENRVGVTGGSYGGYATAWCATKLSERFAAGVMFVGISNKISKIGTTDIPQEEYLVHARKKVYDDFEFFLSRSPIAHVENAQTPLLILHGTDDPRVSVTQSREMYRALKMTSEVPVRLVLYPGEKHGNRRAASRYDYMLRMLRWMEHYLGGKGGDPPPYRVDYQSPADG